MSRLRMVSSKHFEDLLTAAPGALEADTAMRRFARRTIDGAPVQFDRRRGRWLSALRALRPTICAGRWIRLLPPGRRTIGGRWR